MKHFFSIILFLPIFIYSQDYLVEFDKYNPIYSFEWNGLEVQNDSKIKSKFVKYIESNNLMIEERNALRMAEKKLQFKIRAVDINNDKLADIIYQGPCMGEGLIIYIFLQTESGFKKVFTSQQGIVKVDWNGQQLDKLYIRNWGCCADPNLVNLVYKLSYPNDIPSFKMIWKSVELMSFITKPKSNFKPKRFEVTNQKYELRANPWIDDITEDEFLEITGNTIGILKQGFRGTAYGSAEDETGRVWWYVLIDREYEVEETYINYKNHEFKPHLVGWISSRFVKEIEN